MSKRIVQVYYGPGKGKSTAAVGLCIREASFGHEVIIIQFLKGKDAEEYSFLKKLEPDIKLFRFEKEQEFYSDLSDDRKNEEKKNILNGFHFAKKVLDTGECDVLILDEVLGLVDLGIITLEDIISLIQFKDDYCKLVLTGQNMKEELMEYADIVSKIEQVKVPNK